jgi:hypothetical protein
MCVMCPDHEVTSRNAMPINWPGIQKIPFMRKTNVAIPQQTKSDPDDDMTQRHDAMKLAMNDPDKMREYYEPPRY